MIPKFIRGDIVYVSKERPEYKAHFKGDFKAVILEASARQQEGHHYQVLDLSDGNKIAWYDDEELTFIRHISERSLYTLQNKMKSVWERRRERIEKRNSKAIIKVISRKKRYPEGTLARMYQDAFDKSILELASRTNSDG